jgi:hypothetical protein
VLCEAATPSLVVEHRYASSEGLRLPRQTMGLSSGRSCWRAPPSWNMRLP